MLIYQIYPRSFKDSNADGIGDLAGILEKVPYIARLGVDAVWVSPFVTSPQKDFGYDVSNYCDIDPRFGTLADFKKLIKALHAHGIKMIMDQVWCHSSDQHPWFIESRSSRNNEKADWYIWADPKPDGTPPNNWLSYFGGSAWAWDTTRQQYYFHQFLESQPTFNLRHPEVVKAIMEIGRFWLNLGVDGFRLDAIHTGFADPKLRNNPARPKHMPVEPDVPRDIPQARQIRLHSEGHEDTLKFLESVRRMTNAHGAVLLGEVAGETPLQRAASYVGKKRLHMAYTFSLLREKPNARLFAQGVAVAAMTKPKDVTFCYTLSNHDVPRVVTKWAIASHYAERTAHVAMLFGLSLPGAYCMYQGEELGLPEADVLFEHMVDPFGIAFYPKFKGRDGCRTPMPWQRTGMQAGFSGARKTWLPVFDAHRAYAVDVQEKDQASMLHYTRRMIAWRKTQSALKGDGFKFIPSDGEKIVFERFHGQHRLLFVFNLGAQPAKHALSKTYAPWHVMDAVSISVERLGDQLTLKPMSVAVLCPPRAKPVKMPIKPSKKSR